MLATVKTLIRAIGGGFMLAVVVLILVVMFAVMGTPGTDAIYGVAGR